MGLPPGTAILQGWGDKPGHRAAQGPVVRAQSAVETSPEEEMRAVLGSGEAAQGHMGVTGPWQRNGGSTR